MIEKTIKINTSSNLSSIILLFPDEEASDNDIVKFSTELTEQKNCFVENQFIENKSELNEESFPMMNDFRDDSVPEIIYTINNEIEIENFKSIINVFSAATFLLSLQIKYSFEKELLKNLCFEKRLINKHNNKDYLTRLWRENLVELLVENSDPLVDQKFNERFNWLKETYFNAITCNEDEKLEDFNEWCRDKDITNIFKFMKTLSKQIQLKNEVENNLQKELKRRKNIENQYKQILGVESAEFNQIYDNLRQRMNSVQKNQVIYNN
jgi:hypothetical protein